MTANVATPPKYGVWINGSSGRMGLEIQKSLLEDGKQLRLIGGSSRKFEGAHFHQGKVVTKELLAETWLKTASDLRIDLLLDFSTLEGNQLLLESIEEAAKKGLKNKALLIGTTGLSPAVLKRWQQVACSQQLTLLMAPNTSIGILLTVKAALLAAGITTQMGFDIEIVETHHRMKVDAPSGTAKFIANTLVENIEGLSLCLNRRGARQRGEVGVHAVRGGSVFGEHEVRIIGDSEEITISHRAFSRALFAKGALVLSTWLMRQKPGVYGLMDINVQDLKS